MMGQLGEPGHWDPMADLRPHVDYKRYLDSIRRVAAEAAEVMPRHEDFIARLCGSGRQGSF